MKLVFLGPPGAGKGTQAQRIMREYGVIQISTGDLLRANIRNNTVLGIEAAKFINQGDLVSDDLIVNMIKNELEYQDMDNGYLLDGFPRTLPQAKVLDKMLKDRDEDLNAVLVLNVPEEDLIKRLSGRRTCSRTGKTFHMVFNPPKPADLIDINDLYQREDDKEETVKRRLEIYRNQTQPLIEYYTKKGKACEIDGTGNLTDVFGRIKSVLDKVIKDQINN